jgi:hypothetical protein
MQEDRQDPVVVVVGELFLLQILVDLHQLLVVTLVELILVLVEPQEIQTAVLAERVDLVFVVIRYQYK